MKHDYSISTDFSYQIPLNQGFPDHHVELRELQGIMQHFSHKFDFFRFQLHYTSYIYVYHSYQIIISDSSRSRLPGSLLQTQGTTRYYATFISQISFLSLPITLDIKYITLISNSHIIFLQIEAFRVTTSHLGNFKVLCNISLTNFIPFAFNQLNSLKSMLKNKNATSYQIPLIQP